MKRRMAKEYKFGRMDQFMKDFGQGIWLLEKEDSIMQMGIFMKE